MDRVHRSHRHWPSERACQNQFPGLQVLRFRSQTVGEPGEGMNRMIEYRSRQAGLFEGDILEDDRSDARQVQFGWTQGTPPQNDSGATGKIRHLINNGTGATSLPIDQFHPRVDQLNRRCHEGDRLQCIK